MKRKYRHNKNLIQELYGRSFTLESLLNEQEAGVKEKFKQIIRKAKGINVRKKGEDKVSITSASADVEDTAISIDDAISQLNTELADEGITDERKAQIANISDKLSKVVSSEQSAQFEKINSQAGGSSSVAGTKDKKSSSKSGNSKVVNIQKIIDPDAKYTKPDGKWGKGTSKAWHEWVASNFEAINKLIKDEGVKLAGDSDDLQIKAHILAERAGFTPNVAGVELLCNKISGSSQESESNAGDTGESELISSFKPLWKIANREGSVWRGYTDVANIKNNVKKIKDNTFNFVKDDAIFEFKLSNVDTKGDMQDIDGAIISIGGTADAFGRDGNTREKGYEFSDWARGQKTISLNDLMNKDNNTMVYYKRDALSHPKGVWRITNNELFRIFVYALSIKFGINNDIIKESHTRSNGVILGKSRGQLYRERYRRRY